MNAAEKDNSVLKADKVISDYIFRSDFYEIKNWAFDFTNEKNASSGFNDCLCVVLVRTGNFRFDLSKQTYDMHTGHVLIDKPDYEYSLRPATGQCSILNFTDDFYHQFTQDLNLNHTFFFSNPNILSMMLKTSPEMEYLHYQLLKSTNAGKLKMDNIIIELLKMIVNSIMQIPKDDEINGSLKRFHLVTMEKAKEYIHENFNRDISLFEISSYACVSPFYFSRIFKKFTSFSPHQYLQNIRLKHSEMLLKTSIVPVAEVSFQSGFTSADYFATSFRQKYGRSPSDYRKKVSA